MKGVSAALVIADKDFRLARSYRLAYPLGVASALFGLLSFRFISKLVETGQFRGDSASYFRYVVIGLAVSTLAQQASASPPGAARNDQVQGTLEYLATLPIAKSALGFGWGLYGVVQTLIISTVACALFVPFGFTLSGADVPAAVAALILVVILFASLGNVAAAVVVALQQGQQLVTALGAGLGLISGTLFPLSELPSEVRRPATFSPLYDGLNVIRSGLLPHQPHTNVGGDLFALLVWATVAAPVSVLLLKLAFRYAQRRGSLSIF